jgi:hypothetical protein
MVARSGKNPTSSFRAMFEQVDEVDSCCDKVDEKLMMRIVYESAMFEQVDEVDSCCDKVDEKLMMRIVYENI